MSNRSVLYGRFRWPIMGLKMLEWLLKNRRGSQENRLSLHLEKMKKIFQISIHIGKFQVSSSFVKQPNKMF